jgi:hypothetical protein
MIRSFRRHVFPRLSRTVRERCVRPVNLRRVFMVVAEDVEQLGSGADPYRGRDEQDRKNGRRQQAKPADLGRSP